MFIQPEDQKKKKETLVITQYCIAEINQRLKKMAA